MSCLDSNVFVRIYLFSFRPSLVLRYCTHAAQVNCIFASKGQYVLVCLRTLISKQFSLCSFETLLWLMICLRFRLTFPVLNSAVFFILHRLVYSYLLQGCGSSQVQTQVLLHC